MEDKIIERWQVQKNNEITSISRFSGWQSNDTFLVNKELVIKVYKNKEKYQKTKSLQDFGLDFVPKIYECCDHVGELQSPVVVMEYIDWKPLTDVYQTLLESEKLTIANKIWLMLKEIHQREHQDIIFDAKKLLWDTVILFEKAKLWWLISSDQISTISHVLDSYRPTPRPTAWCRIHWDMHIENILLLQNWDLCIIDRDSSQINHPVMECGMLLEQSIIPLGIVAEDLENYYPHWYCIDMLRDISNVYPELFSAQRKDEILLQWIQRLLYKYCVDPKIPWLEKALGMWQAIYDEIFENKLIEELIWE